MGLVPQRVRPGSYAGPVLHGRYQVIGCPVLWNQFIIADLANLDHFGRSLVRHGVDIARFASIAEAEQQAARLTGVPLPKEVVKRQTPAAGVTRASRCRELLQAGKTDDEVYRAVLGEFGSFNRSSVQYYRSQGFTLSNSDLNLTLLRRKNHDEADSNLSIGGRGGSLGARDHDGQGRVGLHQSDEERTGQRPGAPEEGFAYGDAMSSAEAGVPGVFHYRKPPAVGLFSVIAVGINTTTELAWFVSAAPVGHELHPKIVQQVIKLADFRRDFIKSNDDPAPVARLLYEHGLAYGFQPVVRSVLARYLPNLSIFEDADMSTHTNDHTSGNNGKFAKGVAATAPDKAARAKAPKTEPVAKAPKAEPVAKAPKAEKTTKAEKTPAFAKEPKTPATKPAKEPSAGRAPSVSSRMRELIIAGKLSDDAIFEAVKKEFGLDDSKRSYVGWNRGKLAKDGMNPPAAVGAKPKAKAEPKAKAAANK